MDCNDWNICGLLDLRQNVLQIGALFWTFNIMNDETAFICKLITHGASVLPQIIMPTPNDEQLVRELMNKHAPQTQTITPEDMKFIEMLLAKYSPRVFINVSVLPYK
jgi:hypothetical protein